MSANRLSSVAAAWLAICTLGQVSAVAGTVVATVPDAQLSGSLSANVSAGTDDPSGSSTSDDKSATVTGPGQQSVSATASNSYGGTTRTSVSDASLGLIIDVPTLSSTLTQSVGAFPATSYGEAYGSLSYSLMIVGPAGLVPVEVFAAGGVSGSFSGTADHGGFGLSSLAIFDAPGADPTPMGQITANTTFDFTTSAPASFTLHGTYQAATNTVYTIDLSLTSTAFINATELGGGDLTLNTWVDPWFDIVGPDADLYSIILSPGVRNPVPTPDGGSVAGMLGLASVLLLTLRRWFR